jgi:membrane-associated phospholipid phosphatase
VSLHIVALYLTKRVRDCQAPLRQVDRGASSRVLWRVLRRVLLLLVGGAGALRARQPPPPPTTQAAPAPAPAAIHWWQGAAVLGAIGLATALDQPTERYVQEERSAAGDHVAAVARRMGQPEVFATVAGGVVAAGLVTGRPALRRAGERVATSLILAGVGVTAIKLAVGRGRPSQGADADDVHPFSGAESFPSGHTTMAFALATALADEIRRPGATIALEAAAAATAWSRVNDNKHWLSDVLAGASLGVASSQLVEGRWTVFHLHPPRFLVTPAAGGVALRASVALP